MAVLRTLQVDASTLLPPAARSRLLAQHARTARDALIREGRAAPGYITVVDGREGASEDGVRPDGRILYVFAAVARATAFAQAYLVGASPKRSGDFRRAWILVVDGARWQRDPAAIPPGAVVHLVNTSDYARRIETGRRKRPGLGFKLVEKTRQALLKRFPELQIERRFLAWSDAYVLKGATQVQAKQNRRSSAFRGGRAVLSTRADRRKGERITLPAVEIRARR
jgi:hypothetical protein